MKHILAILKKEIDRVLKDKRLILMVFLFPGAMIYLMYSMMGNLISEQGQETSDYVPNIVIVNKSTNFFAFFDSTGAVYNPENISEDKLEEKKALLKSGEIELIIVFEENFDAKLANKTKPKLEMFYNPIEDKSNDTYYNFYSFFNYYKTTLEGYTDYFSINHDSETNYEILDEHKRIGFGFASMLPFLIVMFLFSGAMSISPESIAGEKERGSMATLLITPVKRRELVMGKVFGVSILALISALSSFLGIMLSIPKLMQMQGNTNIYSFNDYAVILLLLFATVLVIVASISILSCLAKSVKEATMLVMPLYIVTIVIGILSMFSQGATENSFLYLIPLYNTVQSLSSVFLFEINALHITLTIVSNIIFTAILIYVLSLMFNNEKVMFSK